MPPVRDILLTVLAVAAVGVVLGLLFGFDSQAVVIGVVVGLVAGLSPHARRRRAARRHA